MKSILNFIGNEALPSQRGQWLDVYEPATGEVYARVAQSEGEDVDAAVAAAQTAFPGWSQTPPEARAEVLNRIADLIERNQDSYVSAESRDTGKPTRLAAQVDIPRAVSNFRFFASAAIQFSSESHAMGSHAINYTLRQPVGVAACISPWNLPLYMLSWKVAPALACGNTVIAKPSEIAPASAELLAETCVEAGLAPGVLNIVNGSGPSAGEPLVVHQAVQAISFTGSTATGDSIARSVAGQFKKLSLEMGGKNPALVFADCDLDRTVREVARSAFTNQGQICLCGSRILVQDSIYDEFTSRLLHFVESLITGDPQRPDTDLGAIVSSTHFEKITGYLDLARAEGGTVLCGGPATLDGRCANGWFVSPVLIEGLPNRCRTNREEIFGPVATLQRFPDEQTALAIANDSDYGLACSIWSRDIDRCHRVAARVECGIVWVNCWLRRDLRTPFGGMKASGLGREGGEEAMRFFTEPKNVCVEYAHE
jgi:aminomuconate-semialdehyde/2-hydroxymuconate-6-semialdehyde dehydrogenase